jgi:hypothetical protein
VIFTINTFQIEQNDQISKKQNKSKRINDQSLFGDILLQMIILSTSSLINSNWIRLNRGSLKKKIEWQVIQLANDILSN